MKVSWISITATIVLSLIIFTSCETREESIIRENKYIEDHAVEEVPRYWDEVEYTRVNGESLTLDVSAPEGEGPFPILIIIHGGGWYMHTNTIMEGMARYITNRGYVVFNINYRMIPDTRLKQIVEDCIGALIWVKDHASEYKGDPARLCVTGDSAGGHMTAMLVTQANDPAFTPSYMGQSEVDRSISCAIPTYGAYDLIGLYKIARPYLRKVVGTSYRKDPELFKLLSPYHHIRSDLPPQLVMVGTKDLLYPENKKYVKALREIGAPVEFEVYKGLPHAFLNEYWAPRGQNGYDRMIEFMDKHLNK